MKDEVEVIAEAPTDPDLDIRLEAADAGLARAKANPRWTEGPRALLALKTRVHPVSGRVVAVDEDGNFRCGLFGQHITIDQLIQELFRGPEWAPLWEGNR